MAWGAPYIAQQAGTFSAGLPSPAASASESQKEWTDAQPRDTLRDDFPDTQPKENTPPPTPALEKANPNEPNTKPDKISPKPTVEYTAPPSPTAVSPARDDSVEPDLDSASVVAPLKGSKGTDPGYWRPPDWYSSSYLFQNIICIHMVFKLFELVFWWLRLKRYFTPKVKGELKCSKEAMAMWNTTQGRALPICMPCIWIAYIHAL